MIFIRAGYSKLSRLSGNEKTHCPGLPTRSSMCDLPTPPVALGIMTYLTGLAIDDDPDLRSFLQISPINHLGIILELSLSKEN